MKKLDFKGLMFAYTGNTTQDSINKTHTYEFDGFITKPIKNHK